MTFYVVILTWVLLWVDSAISLLDILSKDFWLLSRSFNSSTFISHLIINCFLNDLNWYQTVCWLQFAKFQFIFYKAIFINFSSRIKLFSKFSFSSKTSSRTFSFNFSISISKLWPLIHEVGFYCSKMCIKFAKFVCIK